MGLDLNNIVTKDKLSCSSLILSREMMYFFREGCQMGKQLVRLCVIREMCLEFSSILYTTHTLILV